MFQMVIEVVVHQFQKAISNTAEDILRWQWLSHFGLLKW